jgi:histidine ammonia-lyase
MHPNIPHPWAPFLNRRTPGLHLALQGLQFVATSTAAHSQTLGYPQYLHSIPTNGDNQDVVSLGTDAALIADVAVRNAFVVVAIEMASIAQAIDCIGGDAGLCDSARALYREVREVLPAVDEDRSLTADLQRLVERIRTAAAPVAAAEAIPL